VIDVVLLVLSWVILAFTIHKTDQLERRIDDIEKDIK
jgi:hypothetical protein